jgi:hypothetical protein
MANTTASLLRPIPTPQTEGKDDKACLTARSNLLNRWSEIRAQLQNAESHAVEELNHRRKAP